MVAFAPCRICGDHQLYIPLLYDVGTPSTAYTAGVYCRKHEYTAKGMDTHNRLRHGAAYARAAARAEEDLALEDVRLEHVRRVRDRGGIGFEGHGGSV